MLQNTQNHSMKHKRSAYTDFQV